MSDLVKRLRMGTKFDTADKHEAADRIEALESTLRQAHRALDKIKSRVCGEAKPNWDLSWETGQSRGVIADAADEALATIDKVLENR